MKSEERKLTALKTMYNDARLIMGNLYLVEDEAGDWFCIGNREFRINKEASWRSCNDRLAVSDGGRLRVFDKALKMVYSMDIPENWSREIGSIQKIGSLTSIKFSYESLTFITSGSDKLSVSRMVLLDKNNKSLLNLGAIVYGDWEDCGRCECRIMVAYNNELGTYKYWLRTDGEKIIEYGRKLLSGVKNHMAFEVIVELVGIYTCKLIKDVEIDGKLRGIRAIDIEVRRNIFNGCLLLRGTQGSMGLMSFDGKVIYPMTFGVSSVINIVENEAGVVYDDGSLEVVNCDGEVLIPLGLLNEKSMNPRLWYNAGGYNSVSIGDVLVMQLAKLGDALDREFKLIGKDAYTGVWMIKRFPFSGTKENENVRLYENMRRTLKEWFAKRK